MNKMQRNQFSSGTPWEAIAVYSRAVRVGPFVYVSGTTASDTDGQIQHPGDLYGQATCIFKKIEAALHCAGARMQDVVRTRVYITQMASAAAVMRAHYEVFGSIRPANTLVEVSALATPEMLVEIEADAVVTNAEET